MHKKFLTIGILLLLPFLINSFFLASINQPSIALKINESTFIEKNDVYLSSIENESLLVHNMEIKIRLDLSLKIISTFILTNNNSEVITFFLLEINKNITSVFSYDPLGPLPFTWIVQPTIGNKINTTMRYPLLPNSIYVFSVSYEIEEVVNYIQGSNEFYLLDLEVVHPRRTQSFSLEISLPIYTQLIDSEILEPVVPSPNKIITEDDIIKLTWNGFNKDINDIDFFSVRFISNPYITTNGKINPLSYSIILAFLGGCVITFSILFLIYKKHLTPHKTELVSSLLSNAEQEVIKAINQDGGVSTQNRICSKTGYSKSKASQILKKLEDKDILKRQRWGRTNKVSIINPTFKSIKDEDKIEEEKK